jgi:membrane protease YdiL (CAAX protease family)
MATLTRVRLAHYALTGFFELLLVGWVYLGLRLRKHSMSSLFGAIPRGLNNITQEIGVAALFWIISMSVLGTIGFTWNLVQNAQYQHEIATHPAEKSTLPSPQEQQVSAAKKLTSLAPANGVEVAAWGVLCLIVGFSEELIFRGYLQTQAALFLKRVPLGVLLSSLIFGAAHGYEGVRGIVLITVFGALFSAVTLLRRSLFPGMIAHAWHDFFTGMALAFIRESHMLDHLPKKL